MDYSFETCIGLPTYIVPLVNPHSDGDPFASNSKAEFEVDIDKTGWSCDR